MYLSQLQLNPRDRGARQCIRDAHDLHRTVMRAFSQAPAKTNSGPREQFGVLYRLETHPRRPEVKVLVQSLAEPDWSKVDMGFFSAWPECKRIDRSLDALGEGMILSFRLRANPTRRVHREPDEAGTRRWKGKRVALTVQRDPVTGEVTKDADQMRLEWLQRKGEQGGFELVELGTRSSIMDVRVTPEDRVFGSGRRKTFWPVLYEGHLRIADVECFRATLVQGIGPAKAYGFGLLSVAPSRR